MRMDLRRLVGAVGAMGILAGLIPVSGALAQERSDESAPQCIFVVLPRPGECCTSTNPITGTTHVCIGPLR